MTDDSTSLDRDLDDVTSGEGWQPKLLDLWKALYDSRILERYDLSREWSYVEANPQMTLSSHIKDRYPLTDGEIDKVLRLTRFLVEGDLSKEERTLLSFNLVPLLEHYLDSGETRFLEYLCDLIPGEARENHSWRAPPEKASIELTNSCNLNCVMCGVGAKGFDQSRTMSLSLFREIIQKLGPNLKCARLNGLGESTIIPNFTDYLDTLDGTSVKLELVTNLSCDDEKLLERLLGRDILIFVSCDSTKAEKMVRIRRGLNIDIFMRNLKSISSYVRSNRRDKMDCQIIMTLMEHNFRELPEMVEFAWQYDFGGVIGNMVKDDNGSWKVELTEEIIETFREAARKAENRGIALKVPDQIEGIPLDEDFVSTSNATHCPTMMEEVFIRYNGDVCPCNMMNPYVYGNLARSQIARVINSVSARVFYALSNTDLRHPYCLSCYYMR